MSDLMKYNAILPKDDDYHLWYDSLKGWRLNIRGVGNSPFNLEAEVLFEIERERIIDLLKELAKSTFAGDVWHINPFDYAIALIKGEQE